MADGVDAVDRLFHDSGIPDVALDQVGPVVEPRVGRQVEDSHIDARVQQSIDDVGPDEPTPAGDEDLHGVTVPPESGRRTSNRQPSPSLRTEMLPWWASTRPRATASPRPAPAVPGVRAASPR